MYYNLRWVELADEVGVKLESVLVVLGELARANGASNHGRVLPQDLSGADAVFADRVERCSILVVRQDRSHFFHVCFVLAEKATRTEVLGWWWWCKVLNTVGVGTGPWHKKSIDSSFLLYMKYALRFAALCMMRRI